MVSDSRIPPPSYTRYRKRIIVCCDGTWQTSVSGQENIPSNVTRLARHLASYGDTEEVNEKTGKKETTLWKQVIFYDAGIGTGALSGSEKSRQGGTGAGLDQNVLEAYNFIVTNYSPGDKVYCFGFSRGAYTARSLSGMITDLGICSPLDMQGFPAMYQNYQMNWPNQQRGENKQQFEKRLADYAAKKKAWFNGDDIELKMGDKKLVPNRLPFKYTNRKPIDPASCNVEVVGVWDTVGSLGVPAIFGAWKMWIPFLSNLLDKPGHEFHDVALSDKVHHAFHALAMDERRKPFSPTLWYVDWENKEKKLTNRPKTHTLKQTWFPGVHINCGGGSDDVLTERRGDFEGLANITFAWMVEQLRPHLDFKDGTHRVAINSDEVEEDSFEKAIKNQKQVLDLVNGADQPYALTWWRRPRNVITWIGRLFGSKPAEIKSVYGWGLGPIVDSFLDNSIAIQLGWYKWRRPGHTWVPATGSNSKDTLTSDLGETMEFIHPSVWYRIQETGKIPTCLKDWVREKSADRKYQGWRWRHTKATDPNDWLSEDRIEPDQPDRPANLERRTAKSCDAGDYLQKLDLMYDERIDKTGDTEGLEVGHEFRG